MTRGFDLSEYLKRNSEQVDEVLTGLLRTPEAGLERLYNAMRYSVFAGGKRLRPTLVIGAANAVRAFTEELNEGVLHAAAAVELLHTYSLIHDDLPAMDDDDLRRGKPTCHKAYDEATAILAGDALQSMAYETLADLPGVDNDRRMACIQAFGHAAGARGMVGGQMADLECEGKNPITREDVAFIHTHKTGALIRACCEIGCLIAEGTVEQRTAIATYGESIGLAFQIIDDILDVTATSDVLGKTAGKDDSSHKATYPAAFGLDSSRRKAQELIEKAIRSLEIFKDKAVPLKELAKFIASRDH